MSFLGIDLGTSSVKVVVVDDTGGLLASNSAAYPTNHPLPGAAEQNPEDWWQAVGQAVRSLPIELRESISAIGLSGQMHGTVCLGADLGLLRPAIIWSDTRGSSTALDLTARIGKPKLADLIGTSLAAGFQAVSIAWLHQHEPSTWQSIRTVLLPKDFLRFRLTGELATEPSDAASTGMLDVFDRRWSAPILAEVGLDESRLPLIGKSAGAIGVLTREAQTHLGIDRPIPVAGGGGDASLAAVASGVSSLGQTMLTLSSGAQATSFIDAPNVDLGLRTHTFASPLDPDLGECGWYVMGATLAAGSALRWLQTNVFNGSLDGVDRLAEAAGNVPAGSGGLVFVPYISGERTPHMDANARGAFIGLTADHDQRHLTRAVMEGAVFALKDAYDAVASLASLQIEMVVAGGGARSPLWLQIVADVMNRSIRPSTVADQSAMGAAVLAAAMETGQPASEIGKSWAKFGEPISPLATNVERYEELIEVYRAYYPAFQGYFPMLANPN